MYSLRVYTYVVYKHDGVGMYVTIRAMKSQIVSSKQICKVKVKGYIGKKYMY